jgi:DMSO/TMAO reductase YedYZ molybdopterin-dependent catalytic subunit
MFTRRDLLKAAPLAALPALTGMRFPDDPPSPGLTVRMNEPRNLEAPFSHLTTFRTPTEQFYVRSHFAVPAVDAKTYRLKVEGAVEKPLELTLDDLAMLKAEEKPLTLECAGNGRVFLTPAVPGLQWGPGAVGTAAWAGPTLKTVLDLAGVKKDAVDVVLEGADKGTINSDPKSPGAIPFARSLPLEKALKPEVVLALRMNEKPLTAAHGYPVRAVVGGWYGMASVKWLSRIIVTTKPFQGFFQTLDYSYFERTHGEPTLVPVTKLLPKASIATPAMGDVVPAGKLVTVTGWAWAGESKIAKIEVSTDGGRSWATAKLVGEEAPFCWRKWEFDWTPTQSGPAKLLARATDDAGNTQPADRDPDRRTYMINHLVPVEVMVR